MTKRLVTDAEAAEWAATLRLNERMPGYALASDSIDRIHALLDTREELIAALERIASPPQDKPGPLRETLKAPYEDCREVARAILAQVRDG